MQHKILIKEKKYLDIALSKDNFILTIFDPKYKINDQLKFRVWSMQGIYDAIEIFIISEIRFDLGIKEGFCIIKFFRQNP